MSDWTHHGGPQSLHQLKFKDRLSHQYPTIDSLQTQINTRPSILSKLRSIPDHRFSTNSDQYPTIDSLPIQISTRPSILSKLRSIPDHRFSPNSDQYPTIDSLQTQINTRSSILSKLRSIPDHRFFPNSDQHPTIDSLQAHINTRPSILSKLRSISDHRFSPTSDVSPSWRTRFWQSCGGSIERGDEKTEGGIMFNEAGKGRGWVTLCAFTSIEFFWQKSHYGPRFGGRGWGRGEGASWSPGRGWGLRCFVCRLKD